MKTYEEFLNLFKKESPKPIINLKEKVDNFLKKTDVEDIIYAIHSITDELGKPAEIEYFLHVSVPRSSEFMITLIEENNRFILQDHYHNVTSLDSIPNSVWDLGIWGNIRTEDGSNLRFRRAVVCEATFEIEFLFYENQNYDITTGSEESDQNYEILKDFMYRIVEEYKFEESDFQYESRGLRLIFKF